MQLTVVSDDRQISKKDFNSSRFSDWITGLCGEAMLVLSGNLNVFFVTFLFTGLEKESMAYYFFSFLCKLAKKKEKRKGD